jgi:VIT1/CCC1 family predicted Fe2+/Mn2+ transporter
VASPASAEEHLRDLQHDYEDERSAEWMYLRLAELDRDKGRAEMLRELGAYEAKHASLYEAALKRHGSQPQGWSRIASHVLPVVVARIFGVGAVFQFLSSAEAHEIDRCREQLAKVPDEECRRDLQEVLGDEVVHETQLWARARAEQEAGHGVLRSSVLGANDGLVSILALVAGVAGAYKPTSLVLLAGLAGLVAGAFSMAASNYVSVKAEQEAYRAKMGSERIALESARGIKIESLKKSIQEKGFTPEEAGALVSRISGNDQALLRTILFEQHGIGEASFARAGRLAAYTGISFTLAGLLPVIPFMLTSSTILGLLFSVIAGAVGLFLLGVLKTVVTYGSAVRGGGEMLLIGIAAAGLTYLVGYILGIQGIL